MTTFDRRRFLTSMGLAWLPTAATGCGYTAASPAQIQSLAGQLPPSSPDSRVTCPPRNGFRADIHCHMFNAREIPIDGFIRSLAQGFGMPTFMDFALSQVTRPIHRLLVNQTPSDPGVNTPASPPLLAGGDIDTLIGLLGRVLEASAMLGQDKARPIVALIKTLRNVTRSRRDLAGELARTYPSVELFTPTLVDFEYWIKRKKDGEVLGATTPLASQIALHGQISRDAILGRIPACSASFHSFVPFNPLREVQEGTALDMVKRAIEQEGFVGVKLYPASGFMPMGNERLREFRGGKLGKRLDEELTRLYEYCTDNEVPILAHASNGNSFFKDSAWRGSPWAWRRVLESHSALRLCFGHFGHLEGMDGFTMPLRCVAWAEGFLRLILTYDNVYADLSNTPCADSDPKARDEYQKRFLYWLCGRLARANGSEGIKLAQRLIYGSDWWMGMLSGIADQFLVNMEQMIDGAMKPAADVLSGRGIDFKTAFMGDNALRFLGVRNDAGTPEVSRGNGARLRGFYDATQGTAGQYPRWLAG